MRQVDDCQDTVAMLNSGLEQLRNLWSLVEDEEEEEGVDDGDESKFVQKVDVF